MTHGRRAARDDAPPAGALPADVESRLIELHSRVRAECTHYQLLGVSRSADRKTIKRAYYELAALVHPDRHGGHQLGEWKPLMEALFRHITLASDVLSDAMQRFHYDETLPPEPISAPAPPPPPSHTTPVPDSAPMSSRSPPSRSTPAPTSAPLPKTTPAPSPPAPESSRSPLSGRQPSDALRRDALARRLLAGRSMRRPAPSEPSITTVEAPSETTNVANATELRAKAEAEEFRGEFTSAVKSWRRLTILEPKSPDVAYRAAKALMSSTSKDADLHEASELAKRAIAAAPQDTKSHLLLAEIYLQAQLPSAARSVLEHALTLGTNATEVNALLTRVEALAKGHRK